MAARIIVSFVLGMAPVAPSATAVREAPKCVGPLDCAPPTTPAAPPAWTVPDWAHCAEWWPTAQDVGWPETDMPVLDHVMWRESRCDPGATSRTNAQGLTQVEGGCAPYGSCYDPTANLARALDMRRSRGWQPWHLNGDRVTG